MPHAELIERVGNTTGLAGVVAIRTFLSWSLALELDGRCPWQRDARALP